jgi:transposase
MILDLHRQGLSVSAIARRVGVDWKTVRTYIAKGLERRPKRSARRVEPRRWLRAVLARTPSGLFRPDRAASVP